MNGVLNYRSMEDEIMITEIGKTANKSGNMINNSRVIIYDARPKLNAQGNKFKGGGFEDLKNYKNCDLIFCDIDRIQVVSGCFKKMYEVQDNFRNFNSMESYIPLIENSGYNTMISLIFKATNNVLNSMLEKNNNVLVHCSDGWDRTA